MKLQKTGRNVRLKEMILHVAQRCCRDDRFDLDRLNSILFYVDFWSYADGGSSVTGQDYEMCVGGPAPRAMAAILDEMRATHELELEPRPVALRDADLSVFSDAQVAFADVVIDNPALMR